MPSPGDGQEYLLREQRSAQTRPADEPTAKQSSQRGTANVTSDAPRTKGMVV
ncbi:putative sialic acid transporter [Anopheles sinensis]|uniref:Putative sialic acid transporter n=1 Tax=Anopheles sinensis TaxID=74873 RepID=A0A084VWW5_ANOSI|nr:putative sialic acid transporter [Anopheles sinensis]